MVSSLCAESGPALLMMKVSVKRAATPIARQQPIIQKTARCFLKTRFDSEVFVWKLDASAEYILVAHLGQREFSRGDPHLAQKFIAVSLVGLSVGELPDDGKHVTFAVIGLVH